MKQSRRAASGCRLRSATRSTTRARCPCLRRLTIHPPPPPRLLGSPARLPQVRHVLGEAVCQRCSYFIISCMMQLLYHIMHVSIMLFFVQITKFHASLFSKNEESFLSSLEFHRLTSYLSNALSLTNLKQATSNLKREKGATVKEGQKKWQVSLLPIIIIYVCTLYLLIPHSPDIGQLSKGTDSFLISFIRKEQ